MNFEFVNKVTKAQIKFCKNVGLDVSSDTERVAIARLHETIQREFWENTDLGRPTENQVELASKFGIDISNMSRIVGNAIIDDIMSELNKEAIIEQSLKPGSRVRKTYDENGKIYIISSIKRDGTVYFKGGNGQKAWARNLVSTEQ
ncbi:MAG: hypothetical protein FE835_19580 [Gammaproteobacteria bacterium]|nr:hypothetical protein [Gammaproteobacteria bacterium]